MTNSVDPDEMAHYESSHLDLHCLQKYMLWRVKENGYTFREVTVKPVMISLLILVQAKRKESALTGSIFIFYPSG